MEPRDDLLVCEYCHFRCGAMMPHLLTEHMMLHHSAEIDHLAEKYEAGANSQGKTDAPPHQVNPPEVFESELPRPWLDGNLPANEGELAVLNLLKWLDVDEGEHTARTPQRVARAWSEMLWGYRETPDDHLDTTFPAPDDPGLIIQAGIDIQSTCAHHLLPFQGNCTVAYRPSRGQRIVGLSKLTRLAYGYSARLQVQERIGQQIAEAIMSRLKPTGALVLLTASHDCMRLRGVRSPASTTTTEAKHGIWLDHDVQLVQASHSRSLPC